ncbi:hypothetical protein HP456_12710 [Bacillus haikouensis]|uniref:YphA family membrane protein n=1 Tax=Bacillus haikouensis TaxID=1510468 RepID=UPI0015531FC8|nr:hypothetical protein [Bacillus haikouensis]NQD66782.1 hypothetical protein [Bacillus haikouensis]
MEGIIFLWVAWGIWVYTTFIMRKSANGRFKYSFLLLCMICLFPHWFTIFSYEVNAAFGLMALLTFIYIRALGLRQKLYMLIALLTIAMSYAGIGMIAIYDPVLMIIDPQLVAALLSVSLGFLFYSSLEKIRMLFITVMGGCITGDVLLAITLNKIGFVESIGNHGFLDNVAYMVLLTLGWRLFLVLNALMNNKISPKKGEVKSI